MTRSRNWLPVILLAAAAIIGGLLWWFIAGGSRGAVERQHLRAMEALPEGTQVVVTVDAKVLADRGFDELAKGIGIRIDDAETRKEVGGLFESRLGLDPLKVTTLTFFVEGKHTGMLVRGDLEFDPSVGRTKEYEGHSLTKLDGGVWATPLGGALAIGKRRALKTLIDVDRGDRKALAGTATGDQHAKLLDALGGGVLVTTVALDEEMKKGFARDIADDADVAGFGFGLKLDGTGAAVLEADDATRAMLLKKLDELKGQAHEVIAGAKERVDDLDVPEAVGVILADRHMDALFERITPKDTGDMLRLDLGGGSGSVMAVSAALSAVAVPAFIKYMRREKTAEAVDQLDKIYKGALDYYSTPRVDRSGEPVPCQFPEDAPLTPTDLGCCDPSVDRDGDCRCDRNPAAWDHPAWAALLFQINDAHYFSYSFDSEGTGADASFTAHAQADLDGDGNFSTFQRFGKGAGGAWGDCEVISGAALYTYNETE